MFKHGGMCPSCHHGTLDYGGNIVRQTEPHPPFRTIETREYLICSKCKMKHFEITLFNNVEVKGKVARR